MVSCGTSSGESMLVSVCNSRSCAWVLNALCVYLIEQQLAMQSWLEPGLRSSSLLVIVLCSPKAMGSTGLGGLMHFYHMHHLVGRTATLLRRQMLLRWTGMQMQSQLQASAMAWSVCLGCPVFKRDFKDDRTSNLWPIERLTPCKLAAVSHCSHPDNLVVLSRFASFMHQVPEVS